MSEEKNQEEFLKDIEETIKHPVKNEVISSFAPTGSFLLDLLVGGGEGLGYPFGRIINFVGDKSSGKTFLACEVIAACRYLYGKKFDWVYDDCESGFSFNTERLYGFHIMPPILNERTRSNTVQDAYVNVRNFAQSLKPKHFGVYVIDSLDGLKSKESNKRADERYKKEMDKRKCKSNEKESAEKGTYGVEKPKYLSQEFFPQLSELLEKTNCLLIIISQVRQNIDPMSFEKFVRAGGSAMDFYCHTVLWLANINKIKRKGRAVGVTIKAKTTKSKTRRPYRESFFTILFDYGLDDISSCVDFLFDFRTETGEISKDAEAVWEGKKLSLDNLIEFLKDNDVEKQYRLEVNPTIKKSELIEWLQEHPTLSKKYSLVFGEKKKREDLILYIEENDLVEKLHQRTEEKWESIEQSIVSKRKPKYR